jgi:acetolactate decarboxylase
MDYDGGQPFVINHSQKSPQPREKTMRSAFLCLSLAVLAAGCAVTETGRDTVYQVSTIDSLMAGNYDGIESFASLRRHGDFGIGTFAGLGGEMVALDGAFYDCRFDGKVVEVMPDWQTPFASVTFFQADRSVAGLSAAGLDELWRKLDSQITTVNLPWAIRIDGEFEYIKVRSVPPQKKPYPPLLEVAKAQPEFEFRKVRGTLVGFRSPPWTKGVNLSGWHLHFISADRSCGGHLLDARFADLTAKLDACDAIHIALPRDTAFAATNLSTDRQKELKQVEQ